MSTTTYRFNQADGSAVYLSEHRDFDGNRSVLLEHHSGTQCLAGIRLTAEQAKELKAALDGWGI